VRDDRTRFNLAIECGNLAVALECAQAIDREDSWQRLAAESLRLGNLQVTETALKRVKNFERLSFLYVVLGDIEKLQKMLKIAELRTDVLSRYGRAKVELQHACDLSLTTCNGVRLNMPFVRYHNALYLGNVDEQLRVLREIGQRTASFPAKWLCRGSMVDLAACCLLLAVTSNQCRWRT